MNDTEIKAAVQANMRLLKTSLLALQNVARFLADDKHWVLNKKGKSNAQVNVASDRNQKIIVKIAASLSALASKKAAALAKSDPEKSQRIAFTAGYINSTTDSPLLQFAEELRVRIGEMWGPLFKDFTVGKGPRSASRMEFAEELINRINAYFGASTQFSWTPRPAGPLDNLNGCIRDITGEENFFNPFIATLK